MIRTVPRRVFALVSASPAAFVTAAAVTALATSIARDAAAQEANVQAAGAAAAAAATGATQGTTATGNYTYLPTNVAPPPPGRPVGGGNVTSSSSAPRIHGENDTFDLNKGGGGSGTARGGEGGPIFLETDETPSASAADSVAPEKHTVKKGDTLWAICRSYFQNPYEWPRVWSYNPQLRNPHYIEVGDQLALRSPAGEAPRSLRVRMAPLQRFADAGRKVVPATVFLREQGYIENEVTEVWGEITGSPEDKTFLSDTDDLYLRIAPDKKVRIGQELTVFRPVRKAGDGRVVALQGTVRVNAWDPNTQIARATMVETLDAVERGAKVGDIPRRFEVVPPRRNAKDVEAKVVASVHFHNFYGQHQVVFIDRGSADGLEPGNQLAVIHQGDAWRASLASEGAARRIDIESNSAATIETVGRTRDERYFPVEKVGALRVLTTREHTAMCLVTESNLEIDPQDTVRAKKGN